MSYKSIFQAIKANNLNAVEEFTINRKVNKNSVNKAGYNIVEIAFYNRNKNDAIVNHLLDYDYPINFASKKMQAIVFSVIKNDDCLLLQKLIQKGLPFNYTSIQGYSLLEFAFFYKSSECLKFLEKHTKIESDPFVMIEKGEFLSVVKFLKANPDYDIYFKKGYKNLLLQSLISRNLKTFLYLLKNNYSLCTRTIAKYVEDEIKIFTICCQYQNEAYLKGLFKYIKKDLYIRSKISLLSSSISNLHYENVKFIYNHFSSDNKTSVYPQFYEYYKTDDQKIIEILYDEILKDKEKKQLRQHTENAVHPAIFYLHKMNKKKYDYYLAKYPPEAHHKEKIAILAFENCNIELVKEFVPKIYFQPSHGVTADCSQLISAFLNSDKSDNIKFKFYKELKAHNKIDNLMGDYSREFLISFYTMALALKKYKFFNLITKNEELKKEQFTLIKYNYIDGSKENMPSNHLLSFFMNKHNIDDDCYQIKKKSKNISTPDDYMKALIYIVNLFDFNVHDNVNIDFMNFVYHFSHYNKPNFSHPKKKNYTDISKLKIVDVLEEYAIIDPFSVGLRSQLEKNHIQKNTYIQKQNNYTSDNISAPARRRL